MAFLEDNVDWITGQIVGIGLATGPTIGDEVSGGGYSRLAPDYSAAVSGTADITEALEFNGPPNEGPVTHLVYARSSGAPIIRPVTSSPASFNSDGRLDLTSAPVSSAFGG